MSTLENRVKALEIAMNAVRSEVSWTRVAEDALNFLETGSFAPAASVQPANPPAAEPAPRKPRAVKPVDTGSTAPEKSPVLVALSPAATESPTAVAPPVAASAPNKEPTLDDVRTALVQCQTRKGGKDVPQAILSKYSSNKTTGGLKKEDFVKVISECAAA